MLSKHNTPHTPLPTSYQRICGMKAVTQSVRLPRWFFLLSHSKCRTALVTSSSIDTEGALKYTRGCVKTLLISCVNQEIYWKLKMAAFWDVAPCSVVENVQRFISAYSLHYQDDKSVSTKLRGSSFQTTAISTLVAVRTWNIACWNVIPTSCPMSTVGSFLGVKAAR